MIAQFLILLVMSPSGLAKDLNVVYKNNSAVSKIQRERVMDAYQEFISLLASSPFDPTLQFNVGTALTLLGDKEKAPVLYKQLLTQVEKALEDKTLEKEDIEELYRVKFGLHYNLGVLHQAAQEQAQALENYQAALEIVPDSKEIKTNIEMMFGSGGGKGDKSKKDDKNKGKDENKDQQDQNGDQGKDDKDKKPQDPKDQKDKKDQGGKSNKPQFDQQQMSMEDLKRIMEELKQQEQQIRAKFQGKGGKNGDKEKEW